MFISQVELLLRSGVAVNRRDSRGYTSLHVAVEMGYDSIVDLLLGNRADVNAADDQMITPLHLGAKRGAFSKELIFYKYSPKTLSNTQILCQV
jgi:ankyrin repeat protein